MVGASVDVHSALGRGTEVIVDYPRRVEKRSR